MSEHLVKYTCPCCGWSGTTRELASSVDNYYCPACHELFDPLDWE